jgi:GH25 family lysozyme M1 (1,4-beta-N-acetylmuramidase)
MLYGVDIHSQYQAGISIARLKAEGYTFVVDKASEGTYIPSDKDLSSAAFKARMIAWVAETRFLGMVPGLYHWLKAGGGAAQAQFFYKQVVDAGGPTGMLIQLDDEDNASYEDARAWIAEWHQLSGGHPVLLYTGKWWWGPRGWDGHALTPYLWDSRYLSADDDTISDDPAAFAARVPLSWWSAGYGGWPTSTILQFTSRGDAGSLGNNVDLNVFRGSRTDLATLTRGGDMLTPDDIPTLRVSPWQYKNPDGLAEWEKAHPGEWYPDMHGLVWDMYRRVRELEERPAASVTLTPADIAAIVEGLAAKLAVPTAQEIAVATLDEDHRRTES